MKTMTRKECRAEQAKIFAEARKKWAAEALADPVLNLKMNGARIGLVRDLFVGPRQRKKFNEFLRVTGAGDHPAYLRFMLAVADHLYRVPVRKKRRGGKP